MSSPATVAALSRLTMLVQRSDKDSVAVAADVSAAVTPRGLAVGGVVRLGRKSPADNAAWLQATSPAPIKIADPEAWTRDDQHRELDKARSAAWPHLSMPLGTPSSADETAWLTEVGQAQIRCGATVLLSPGLWISTLPDLDNEMRLAVRLATLFPDHVVFLNLALNTKWLTVPAWTQTLTSRFPQVAVDGVYLRSQLPSYSQSYTEPRRGGATGYLAGLRAVCQAAATHAVRLWLPNSGLTGWAMCAVGASGAGAGTSWGQRVWLMPGGGPRGIGRYCEERLLHTVRSDMHARLARLPGYVNCRCAHCAALFAGRLWDYELAGLHYLGVVRRAMTSLATQPAATRKAFARAQVDACAAELQRLDTIDPAALSGNRPQHLPLWQAILV